MASSADLEAIDPRGAVPARTAEDAVSDALADLMARYQEGDARAFEELYDLLLPRLHGYLVSLTRNLPRAEDLLQETFLQLHRSRHTYCPPRPVRPWAFGIARHVYLMDLRSAVRAGRHVEPAADELPEVPIPAVALGTPERHGLRRAMARLPDDQREALLLHHGWGFTFAEIGQMLGIRAGAAKVRSHRGIQRLRELLGGTGG